MTKTSRDICTLALRSLGVAPVNGNLSAHDYAFCKDVLESEFARVNVDHGFGWTFDVETVPDDLAYPMAMLVASKVDAAYMVQGPPESRAVALLRSYTFPDDREDSRDTDGDGVISEAEAEAAKRAEYY